MSEFYEYSLADGMDWRVEDGRGLVTDFGLGAGQAEVVKNLVLWHGALCEQELAWKVLCRLYAINPAFGEGDADKFRPWKAEEIAAKLQMPVGEVSLYVRRAQEFWQRYRLAREGALTLATPRQNATERPPLGREAIDILLRKYGFETAEGAERTYIARRVEELEMLLESPQSWTLAVSLIQQEVTITFGLDRSIAKVRKQIAEAGEMSTAKNDEQLMKLTKARSDAQKGVEDTQKMLGLNEDQTGTMRSRAAAQGTIGALLEAIAAYHARGDTSLIDGVFTALEIELLTTPYTLRPIQYRADLVAMLAQATQLNAIFDKEWTPPAFARKAVQRLRAGFREGLARVRDENGEVVGELDDESAGEALDRAEREGERGLAGMGMETAKAGPATQQQVVQSAPRSETDRRRGDNRLTDF